MDYFIIFVLIAVYVLLIVFETAYMASVSSKVEASPRGSSKKAEKIVRMLDTSEKFVDRLKTESAFLAIFIGTFCGFSLLGAFEHVFDRYMHGEMIYEFLIVFVVSIVAYLLYAVGRRITESANFSHPESMIMTLFNPVMLLYYILWPFAVVLSFFTKLVSSVFGINSDESRAMTQEEIMDILNESSEQGVLDKEESEMIQDVFDFSDMRANELMTPRKDVVSIAMDSTEREALDIIEEANYSKYPVIANDSLDEIMGVVSVKNILSMVSGDADFDIRSVITEPLYIPESLPARKVLEIFKKEKQKFGIVVDEYGGMEGIVTLHDLTESIFGDILDEDEEAVPEIVEISDSVYSVQGTMNLNDFMENMDIDEYDDLKSKDFTTVGGMTAYLLGTIPSEGDEFAYRNLKMKVTRMDNRRVDYIEVTKVNENASVYGENND